MKANSDADADFKESQSKMAEITIEILKANNSAKFWHNASLAFCAAGLIWALAQPYFGIRLNGPVADASKMSQVLSIEKKNTTPMTPAQDVETKPKKIGPVP